MLRPKGDPLVQGLADGREEAFAALYDQFGGSLFQAGLVMLGSRQDAEDAVQEVFVGLVRTRRGLRKVKNLRAYLFAALRRAAARLATTRRSERLLRSQGLAGVCVAQPQGLEIEPALRLEQALQALPPEQRQVVALKVEGGLTFAEIASVLGISPNTAASRYRYALEKLRTALKD
jgi:RNA polymerase sigma-70 factor (ECF subfamily)